MFLPIECVSDAAKVAQDYFDIGNSGRSRPSTSAVEVESAPAAQPSSNMENLMMQMMKQMEANTKAVTELLVGSRNNNSGYRGRGPHSSATSTGSRLECFNCGGPHMKRHCPKLTGHSKPKPGNDSSPRQ
ncbi:hypothetical protein EB796_007009 [Bugula neritina]|uniref:Uncharacterized protein n=1 Tax=Bugula neritina TaxID=10212 RepID=A0A7J7K8X1_BUGNE|nr:hypothetical protein EB796_007009 [Bugula neritina]